MTARRDAAECRRGRRSVPLLLLLCVVLVPAIVGSAAAGAPSGPSDAVGAPAAALATQQVDADDALLTVDIRPDGTADWRVEYRVRLDDENATRAFEALATDVEANRSAYTDRFARRMATTVHEAEAATGREMALSNVSVETSVEPLPQRYGVLAYTFEWAGFAAVEGDRLRAGDALGGLFLDEETSLLVSWPSGYAVESVSPAPTEQRERSVLWSGPTDFGPGEPTLVLATGGGPGGLDPSLLGLAVVALVLVGGGLAWWRRYGGLAGKPAPTDVLRYGAASPDAAAAASGPDGDAGDGGGGPSPPDELLSNEERVIALLEERGGRMKQQDVVSALGWTDAKTSQVVGKLRDAGRVEGFRLGRENVLRLPEVDDALADRTGAEPDGPTGDADGSGEGAA